MDEPRLTVEEGIKAYVETGAIPAIKNWGTYKTVPGEGPSLMTACGAGVFSAVRLRAMGESLRDAFENHFGTRYLESFTRGFDGFECWVDPDMESPDIGQRRIIEGYEDGKALRAAVEPWLKSRMPLPAQEVPVEPMTAHLEGVSL
jgi:hypothetical protein